MLGVAVALAGGGLDAGEPDLDIALIEVILDEDLELARFRFLAPGIAARDFDLDGLGPVFDRLCAQVAAPGLRAERPDWDQVVISLSSVAIPFGAADPEVVQAFEGYRIEPEGCIWQAY